MATLESLVISAHEREAAERASDLRQQAELDAIRRDRNVKKVREVACRTFSSEILKQLNPSYDAGTRTIRPSMQLTVKGTKIRLSWREFLWAEPGREDYLEGRNADGTPVQFSPEFAFNDEKLAVLIASYKKQRSWLSWFMPNA